MGDPRPWFLPPDEPEDEPEPPDFDDFEDPEDDPDHVGVLIQRGEGGRPSTISFLPDSGANSPGPTGWRSLVAHRAFRLALAAVLLALFVLFAFIVVNVGGNLYAPDHPDH